MIASSSPVIDSVSVQLFQSAKMTELDSDGHDHPGPRTEITLALLRIRDTDGVEGVVVGKPAYLRADQVEQHLRPVLTGADPLRREHIGEELFRRSRSRAAELPDHTLSYVDQALWDLAGKRFATPVWKLLGGAKERVLAYGSVMCGDDIPGGLATPEDYARFAVELVERGYRGIKLHTWMPPIEGAPSVERDIAACAAVREAVGPGIDLMLDGYHWYSRTQALQIGRALDELKFAWFEEPMDEYSTQSYRWLSEQVATPVVGPETVAGRHRSRADWVLGTCDILRAGAMNTGGITPALKAAHLADAFGMACEIHGHGAANLALVGASPNAPWYERGLLHPQVDYDWVPPHQLANVDPLAKDGHVEMPSLPGLGEQFDFEYIDAHTTARY
ncbi:enolase C-terminal domain-like protein [Mycolicibacterium sp. P9-22]|uniref:enolase C-terminal domain-like protein n=1 Tax=Mycolicibacterium sp. P9-22 TaxID=2024613 RepID=UPI001D14F1EF|nr:enolase C-terminal domain-like protein [Mycolicibacterium sp. P9-22]